MRDDFKADVRRILAYHAGFHCSRPDCRAATAGPGEGRRPADVGVAAHITAASPGGPRYDSSMTPEIRASVSNGIWLCAIHAKEVDDDATTYTVEVLRAWKEHAEVHARAMLGRPVSGQSLDVAIEASIQRIAKDALVVSLVTNLPTGTKLMVNLDDWGGAGTRRRTCKTEVFAGRTVVGPFGQPDGTPPPQAWYLVDVVACFNGPWRQPRGVLEIVGNDGVFLGGPFAALLDPDLEEDDHARVEASFICLAPPVAGQEPYSTVALLDAVAAVKAHRFEAVPGSEGPSRHPVGLVVEQYLSVDGVRERDGWAATEVLPGVVEVTFSYWDGEKPAVSQWHTTPASGAVRYCNREAKWMSWWPDD